MGVLFATILCLLAVFLILLVLVQRGRGGGLTGALGGVGGSSAFGAKAGDVFTRITIVAATIWIIVCVAAAFWAGHQSDVLGQGSTLSTGTAPDRPGSFEEQGAEAQAPGAESLPKNAGDSQPAAGSDGTSDSQSK